MVISEYDKNQILQIDEQVKLLQMKGASDEAIIDALLEFVPDVTCLVENVETKDLQIYLAKYDGFAYFLSLISLTMTQA